MFRVYIFVWQKFHLAFAEWIEPNALVCMLVINVVLVSLIR